MQPIFVILKMSLYSINTISRFITPAGMSVICRYEPFFKSASSDITSGRVHLDVRWIDQSTSLPSGL
jgi:PKD repeat protein